MYRRIGLKKYYIEIDNRRFNINMTAKDPFKQVEKYLIASGFIDRLKTTGKGGQTHLPV